MASFVSNQNSLISLAYSSIPKAEAYEPEDLINEVAAIVLAATGRADLSPKLLRRYQRGQNALTTYQHTYKNDHEKLLQAIHNYNINLRVPLLGIREMLKGYGDDTIAWGLPAEIFSCLKSSPNAAVLSIRSLQNIQYKLKSIDWRAVGTIIERHLRSFFGINYRTPISVNIYGEIVWGNERTNDLDLLLVIDDLESYIAETGGSRHNIVCTGLADFFPYSVSPLTDELDVAIYGLGALCNGTLNHDITNTILWATMNGIQVAGESPIKIFSDWMVCQNVLVTIGYAMKNALINFDTKSKKLSRFVQMELAHCIYLGKKYLSDLDPVIYEWQNHYYSFNSSSKIEDFLQDAIFVAGASQKLFSAIKEKAIENATTIISNLIEIGTNIA